jgi:Bacterial Ig domain
VPPTVSITSPASGASFAAPATIAIAADATDNDGSVTQVQFYSGATLIGTSTTSPFGMTWSNVPAGSYTLTAKATDNSGAVTASRSVATTVTATTPPPPGLPAPWQTQDIGKVGVTGNASVTAGVFTVRGSGADVWGPADAFRFVYQSLAGDGTIIARVASVQNVYAWTKAGVMIRQTTDAGSTQTSMFVTPGKGLSFQRRTAANGTSVSTTIAGAAPYWVRLVRAGQVITASVSPDGTSWTDVGQDTIAISGAVWIGLAVTSTITRSSRRPRSTTSRSGSCSGIPIRRMKVTSHVGETLARAI